MMPMFCRSGGAGTVLAVGRGADTGFIHCMADPNSRLLDRVVCALARRGVCVCQAERVPSSPHQY